MLEFACLLLIFNFGNLRIEWILLYYSLIVEISEIITSILYCSCKRKLTCITDIILIAINGLMLLTTYKRS